MSLNYTDHAIAALEEQFDILIAEYHKREAEGTGRAELIPIYKKIKEIRYQLVVNKPQYQQREASV